MAVTHQSPLRDPRSQPPRRGRWPRRVAIGIAATVSALLATLLVIAYIWQPSAASGYQSRYLTSVDSRFVDTPVARFHYTVSGRGAPVVLVAGGAQWLYSWRDTIPALATRHTVYAVDLPSQGYTTLRQDDFAFDLPAMAGALEAFLNAVGLDHTSLVGHSFGGAWSLYFTEQHPERVDRLVLLDAPGLDAERAPQTQLFRIPVIGEAVAKLMGRGNFADSLRSAFHHQDRVTDEVIDETWGWFSRPENREAFWMLVRNLDFALTDAGLIKVESDTLILWGEQDRWLPASQGTELAERLPNATARVLPGCGHNVHEDCPAQAVPLLTSFLTGLNR